MSKALIQRAVTMFATHLALLELGAELQNVWLRLIMAIVEYGRDGVLDLRSDGAPSLAGLARFRFHLDETQLETYLETYAKTRLITYDAATGLLGLPDCLAPTRRAIASRINGAKGGRPRKNPDVTPQKDPRQRAALLPIPGGQTVSTKTRDETHETRRAPIAKLADNISIKAIAQPAKEAIDAAYAVVGPAAFEAAGYDQARDMGHYGAARQWCADGLASGLTQDEIMRLVVAKIAAVAERERVAGRQVRSLGYFGKAVTQAIAERDVPDAPKSAARLVAERELDRAMRAYFDRRAAGDMSGTIPQIEDYLAAEAA